MGIITTKTTTKDMRKFYFVTLMACLLATGCAKETFRWRHAGEVIQFSASSNSNNYATKTVYSGKEFEENDKTYERIDWLTSDDVRIICNSEYADYDITSIEASNRYSKASLSSDSDDALTWPEGTTKFQFYALYPSPTIAEKSTGGLTASISGSKASLTLPSVLEQTTNANGQLGEKPMHYAFMVASNNVEVESEIDPNNPVELHFNPIVTTFYITLKNNFASESTMILDYVKLISKSHQMAGKYVAYIPTETTTDNPSAVTFSSNLGQQAVSSVNYVMANLNGRKVEYGKSTTITLFAYPGTDLNDLTIEVGTRYTEEMFKKKYDLSDNESILPSGITYYSTKTTRALTYNGEGVTFEKLKKNNISLDVKEPEFKISAEAALLLAGSGVEGVTISGNNQDRQIYYNDVLVYEIKNKVGDVAGDGDEKIENIKTLLKLFAQVSTIKSNAWLAFKDTENTSIDAIDVNLFCNATTFNIEGANNGEKKITIEINGHSKLQKIEGLTGEFNDIKITNCPEVTEIELGNNGIPMNEIYIENMPKLDKVTINGSANLRSVHIANCDALTYLELENVTDLTSLYIVDFKSLETLIVNNANQMQSLEIGNCPALKTFIGGYLQYDDNGNVKMNDDGTYVVDGNGFAGNLKYLDVYNCPAFSQFEMRVSSNFIQDSSHYSIGSDCADIDYKIYSNGSLTTLKKGASKN